MSDDCEKFDGIWNYSIKFDGIFDKNRTFFLDAINFIKFDTFDGI